MCPVCFVNYVPGLDRYVASDAFVRGERREFFGDASADAIPIQAAHPPCSIRAHADSDTLFGLP